MKCLLVDKLRREFQALGDKGVEVVVGLERVNLRDVKVVVVEGEGSKFDICDSVGGYRVFVCGINRCVSLEYLLEENPFLMDTVKECMTTIDSVRGVLRSIRLGGRRRRR